MRQLASYLATPIFLVDRDGTLVFYNEAAEELLGRGFEDLPEMERDEWLLAFQPHELDGSPLSADDNPLTDASTIGGWPSRASTGASDGSRSRPSR